MCKIKQNNNPKKVGVENKEREKQNAAMKQINL